MALLWVSMLDFRGVKPPSVVFCDVYLGGGQCFGEVGLSLEDVFFVIF